MSFLKKLTACIKILVHLAWIWVRRRDPDDRRFLLTRNGLFLNQAWAALFGRECRRAKLYGYEVDFPNFEEFRRLVDEIFGKKVYEYHTPKKSPFIIDCGANIGVSALWFKRAFPDAKILAFEPDPATFRILKKNITGNSLENVELSEAAVSDQGGEMTFFKNESDSHSLLSSSYRERVPNPTSIRVRAIRLSDCIREEVDLLKMDIEGGEEAVLKDLAATKKLGMIREMILEYHHHLQPAEERLASFLKLLEENRFGYQIGAAQMAPPSPNAFQDLLIRAYRK